MTFDINRLRDLHAATDPATWVRSETETRTYANWLGQVTRQELVEEDWNFFTAVHAHLPELLNELEMSRQRLNAVREVLEWADLGERDCVFPDRVIHGQYVAQLNEALHGTAGADQ